MLPTYHASNNGGILHQRRIDAVAHVATPRQEGKNIMALVPASDPRIMITGAPGSISELDGTLRIRRIPGIYDPQMPSPFMKLQADSSAGVRLRFRTDASTITVHHTVFRVEYEGFGQTPANIQLRRGEQLMSVGLEGGAIKTQGEGTPVEYGPAVRSSTTFTGIGVRDAPTELLLPPGAVVDVHGIEADRDIEAAPVPVAPVWIHHGSSISHCSTMADATATWPSVAATELGFSSINMSLAGNAQLDPFVARVIADTPANLITLKLGINLVNFDTMTLRAFAPAVHGWIDTIRERQPTTPVVIISPIYCRAVETAPGPTTLDPATYSIRAVPIDETRGASALTLERIRAELERIVDIRSVSDPHLRYLDGRRLLDEEDDLAGRLPDGIHPDEEGYRLMGLRFAAAFNNLHLTIGSSGAKMPASTR